MRSITTKLRQLGLRRLEQGLPSWGLDPRRVLQVSRAVGPSTAFGRDIARTGRWRGGEVRVLIPTELHSDQERARLEKALNPFHEHYVPAHRTGVVCNTACPVCEYNKLRDKKVTELLDRTMIDWVWKA